MTTTYSRLAVAALLVALSGCATEPAREGSIAEQGYRAAALGDLGAAENLLTQARAQEPNNVEVIVTLGEVYQNSGRPALAREAYLGALALAPEVNAITDQGERQTGLAAINWAGENLKQLYLAERGELPDPEPIVMVVTEPAPLAHWVQIGYFVRPGNAQRLWDWFATNHGGAAEGLEVRFVEADGGTKVRIGPFPTKRDADRACDRLRTARVDCFPGSEKP